MFNETSILVNYFIACEDIINFACKKYGVTFNGWINEEVGNICILDDKEVKFQDILLDIKTFGSNLPNVFIDWFNKYYMLEKSTTYYEYLVKNNYIQNNM